MTATESFITTDCNRQARIILFARYCLPLIAVAVVLAIVLPLTAPMQEYLLLGEYAWAELTQGITLEAFLTHAWDLLHTTYPVDPARTLLLALVITYLALDLYIAAERLLSDRTCSTWIMRAHTALLWMSAIGLGIGFMLGFSWRVLQYGTTLDALWFTEGSPVKAGIMFPIFPGTPLLAASVLATSWYARKRRVTASKWYFRIFQHVAVWAHRLTRRNGITRWVVITLGLFVNAALVPLLCIAAFVSATLALGVILLPIIMFFALIGLASQRRD